MNADCVIVDANIAFRCLHAGRGDLRERVGPGGHPQFFSPRFLFVELFKHKKRLEAGANLPEAELLDALYALVSRLEFVNEANIPVGTWVEAHRLCKGIDAKDTPYVALTLYLDGRFWTEDKDLKIALRGGDLIAFSSPEPHEVNLLQRKGLQESARGMILLCQITVYRRQFALRGRVSKRNQMWAVGGPNSKICHSRPFKLRA